MHVTGYTKLHTPNITGYVQSVYDSSASNKAADFILMWPLQVFSVKKSLFTDRLVIVSLLSL